MADQIQQPQSSGKSKRKREPRDRCAVCQRLRPTRDLTVAISPTGAFVLACPEHTSNPEIIEQDRQAQRDLERRLEQLWAERERNG